MKPVKRKLVIATATEGGVFWPMGQAMAGMWNTKVPDVDAVAIKTGGTTENIQKLGFKEVDIAFAISGVVHYAVTGTGDYKVQGPQTTFRGMVALHPNVVHVVVRSDAGIQSIHDLKGRAWGPGARNSGTEINTREILDVFGMNQADVKNFYGGYAETVESMKAGKVDGATMSAGVGGAAVKDALGLGGWTLLPLSAEDVKAITERYPSYFPFTIPAGSYPGQTAPVQTVAQGNILVAREDVPADVVYNLVKEFYENLPSLVKQVPTAADISLENGLKGIMGVVPLHPGAERYFREKGLIK